MEESLIQNYYSGHFEELLKYTVKSLHNAGCKCDIIADAEDIVQDAFVRLLNNKSPIIPVSLPALAYRIVSNRITDYLRHKQHAECHEKYVKCSQSAVDNDTYSYFSARQIEEQLEMRMARMNSKSAQIIRMSIFEGRKVGEISKELNINYKTVEAKLYEARKDIRNYMQALR